MTFGPSCFVIRHFLRAVRRNSAVRNFVIEIDAMNPECKARYELAIAAAKKAGDLAMAYFDKPVDIQWKADESPVTIADQNAEKLIRETLLGQFPSDGLLGEEFGDTPGDSGFRWIIDPIDGTRSFVRGIPLWGTLIGLEYRGDLVAGIARMPALGQTYHALRGQGAYRDDRRIRVSTVDRMEKAHLYYSSISWFVESGSEKQFLDLYQKCERQRGFGDCYGFLLVAEGAGEIMVDTGVHAWDVAALIPIIEEAGGQMTAWNGVVDMHRPDSLASNRLLHSQALAAINP
jgi:histidinol-phosphatase